MNVRLSGLSMVAAISVIFAAAGPANALDPVPATAPTTVSYDGARVTLTESPYLALQASDATWTGLATSFVSSDPRVQCLTGGQVNMFRIGSVTYAETESTSCINATWLTDFSDPLVFDAGLIAKRVPEETNDDGHAPRIDVYLTAGYGDYVPCTREVLPNNTKKYACRTLNYGKWTFATNHPNIMTTHRNDGQVGDISGGGGIIIFTTTRHLYEGCDIRGSNYVCPDLSTNFSTKSFATNSQWYRNAFDKWVESTGSAAQCTLAIYNQDAQALAEDCVPSTRVL